jgi:CMP-N,N'-diacetyllegionaminic acid synthase
MRILFLIPARKGSKGLPGKNTRILGTKPLISHSIDFALENMDQNDELCISTNDPEVVEIAKEKGVSISFMRPEELSDDTASSYDVMIHAIHHYENLNQEFDSLLLLQPTSPFRIQEDFMRLKNLYDKNTDMVVSVKQAKENPYFSLFEENSDGNLIKCKSGEYERRQDAPIVYAFNGSMYLINIESLKKTKISEFKKIKKTVMPEQRSVDIDNMADWILAEYYLTNENS